MGRYSYSNRTEADGLNKIQISFLKKQGFLGGCYGGTMTWTTHGYSETKSTVGIDSKTIDEADSHIRIHYTQTERDTGDKKDFDYKIPLTTTPVNGTPKLSLPYKLSEEFKRNKSLSVTPRRIELRFNP
jgi:hypothetical protein